MPHPNTKHSCVRPSPGVGDLSYNDLSNRVHVPAALHLFSFIYDACRDRSSIPIPDIQAEFEAAGHKYETWPFERLITQLTRAGVVEICSDDKH